MLAAEPMLETLFHTEVCGIESVADNWRIALACRTGVVRISASVIVDASGDAVAATWLGRACAVAPAEKLQRPAYVSGVRCGADLDEAARLRISSLLVKGVREGLLPAETLGLTFRALGRPDEVFGTLDLTGNPDGRDFDPLDAPA